MYQRLSAHLTSVDLPQLDLLDSISRETKSRVETFSFSSNQQSNQGKSTQPTSNTASSTISSNTASNVTVSTDRTCPSQNYANDTNSNFCVNVDLALRAHFVIKLVSKCFQHLTLNIFLINQEEVYLKVCHYNLLSIKVLIFI